jgi:hypothetical protein
MLTSPCMFSWGTFQWVFVTKNKLNKNKISCFAPFVCVSLGLKKWGDFTMSEGHGYPLVYIYIKAWPYIYKSSSFVSDMSAYGRESILQVRAMFFTLKFDKACVIC